MPSLDWQLAAEVATTVSTIAVAASAIVVVMQLRQAARERYFTVTSHLFEIWQSPEFQHDQLFLLHKLPDPTWENLCAMGRGEHAERAIHRVGGYYDRVGNLVRHGLIDKNDILPTIGGYAVAVWYRIQPLIKELRLRENAVLFENYEALLPECHECYVPGIERRADIAVTSTPPTTQSIPPPTALREIPDQPLTNGASAAQSSAALDPIAPAATEVASRPVGRPQMEFSLPDSDGVIHNLSEFTASGPAVLVYARGAWCPFCLRQLSDYADRYRTFRQAGIEVFAVSPESPRRSRRMRTNLKLPFAVLSDSKLQIAKSFGLMDHEKLGAPTPATLVLDSDGAVKLSTLNQRQKSLLAGDMLDYIRALRQQADTHSIPPPKIGTPKPGFLFARAVANIAAGLVIR